MAEGRWAYDPDRLPWLTEDRRPRHKRESTPLLFWAFVVAVLVAGVSYWLGMRSVSQPAAVEEIIGGSPPAATVQLPKAPVEQPPPQVKPPGLPDVRPSESAAVKIPGVDRALPAKPEVPRRTVAVAKPKVRAAAKVSPRVIRARAALAKKLAARKRSAPQQAWPAAVSQGAYGRVARIGTFSSRRQAKKGWWAIVRHYPGMKRLKAVVTPVRSLRDGRTYYRLQFGTTSQAHSEVLCQRMRIIGQSCVVVGLPPRQAGARR
jgi:hypothetical protein